ncbi:MAG: hypothetical protein KJP05_04840, partial [Deltaproteobacteria bacterium]|nr:hypothetical protein [Deltaproteobacteria bacterium]
VRDWVERARRNNPITPQAYDQRIQKSGVRIQNEKSKRKYLFSTDYWLLDSLFLFPGTRHLKPLIPQFRIIHPLGVDLCE